VSLLSNSYLSVKIYVDFIRSLIELNLHMQRNKRLTREEAASFSVERNSLRFAVMATDSKSMSSGYNIYLDLYHL
jgi:hypothetical protein